MFNYEIIAKTRQMDVISSILLRGLDMSSYSLLYALFSSSENQCWKVETFKK